MGIGTKLDESPREMVERTIEVLDGISEFEPIVGGDVREPGDADYGDVPIRGFEVDIEGNGVSVRIGSRFERRCYGLHVLQSPSCISAKRCPCGRLPSWPSLTRRYRLARWLKKPTWDEIQRDRDKRATIPLDPEKALSGLLEVDPDAEPAETDDEGTVRRQAN